MKLRYIAGITGLTAVLAAPAAAQQAPAKKGPSQWPMEQIQGFHVMLVIGETQRSGDPVGPLPEGAARALKDMSDFLPYKHYRVVDTQWSSCCSGPQSVVSGRLQGAIGGQAQRSYGFWIRARSASEGIQTQFVLRAAAGNDPQGASGGTGHEEVQQRQDVRAQLEQELAALDAKESELSRLYLPNHPERLKVRSDRNALHARLAGLESASAGTALIDTSFTMSAGETVVVGTSRLGGDKALIAVVTAAKKRK